MTTRLASALLLAVLLSGLLGGCARKRVTRENYDRIETGMTREQVEEILGPPTDTDVGSANFGDVGISAGSVVWKEDGRSITITFLNDEVLTKSASGL